MSKSRPIVLKDEMVQAILDGKKTQIRRVIKSVYPIQYKDIHKLKCPYGQVDDTLWVKETFSINSKGQILTKVDKEALTKLFDIPSLPIKWQSPVAMPHKYSRMTLEIISIRVDRIQDITWEDIKAEGISVPFEDWMSSSISIHFNAEKAAFIKFWDASNKKTWFSWQSNPSSWQLNPFVWCITFKHLI